MTAHMEPLLWLTACWTQTRYQCSHAKLSRNCSVAQWLLCSSVLSILSCHSAVCGPQPYPGAPYYNGCVFSSGPPYSQVAAGLLNATLTDYAIGGATSGAVPGYLEIPASYANRSSPAVVEVPSSLEQVVQLPLLLSYQSLLYAVITASCYQQDKRVALGPLQFSFLRQLL